MNTEGTQKKVQVFLCNTDTCDADGNWAEVAQQVGWEPNTGEPCVQTKLEKQPTQAKCTL